MSNSTWWPNIDTAPKDEVTPAHMYIRMYMYTQVTYYDSESSWSHKPKHCSILIGQPTSTTIDSLNVMQFTSVHEYACTYKSMSMHVGEYVL